MNSIKRNLFALLVILLTAHISEAQTTIWTEGFEGIVNTGCPSGAGTSAYIPAGWINTSGSYWCSSTSYVHTGLNSIVIRYAWNSWLISTGATLTAGVQYQYSFWYRNQDASTGFTLRGGVNSSQSSSGMTILGTITDPVNTTWVKATYNFTPSTTGTYYFGIQNSSSNINPWYLYVDDISVTTTCTAPGSVSLSGYTTPICSNTSPGTFTATPSGGSPSVYTYLWYKNGASTGVTTQTYNPGALTANTNIYCAASTGTGCVTNSATQTITVNGLPTVGAVASPTTICSTQSSTLTASGANSYSWSPATGLSSITGSPVTANPPSTTTYILTGTDLNSCSNTASVTLTVNIAPSALTVTPSSASLCAGSIQQLVASGGATSSATALSEGFETFPTSNFAASGTAVTIASNTTYYTLGNKSVLISNPGSGATTNASTNNSYELQNNLNLTFFTSAQLTFSHICALEGTSTAWDAGYVQYSTNGGTSWTTFPTSSYTGSGSLVTSIGSSGTSVTGVIFSTISYPAWTSQFTSNTSTPGTGPATSLWKNETINIPTAALSSSQFRIRFQITSDNSVNYYGWLIDNIAITGVGNAPVTWSPLTSLYTDAGATVAYTGGATTTVYTKPLSGITYTATATSGSGCSSSANSVITVTPLPSAPTVGVVDNCGSSDLTASNYTGQLLWSNSETTPSINVTTGGTYTVNQTVNGCTSPNGSGVAAPKTIPSAPTVNVVDNCGSSDLTASNYTGQLLWSNSETTPSINVTTGGTYTVNQTVNGCTSPNGSGVAAPKTIPSAPTVNVVDNCGSSDLTASNYTGQLLWSNSETTPSINVTTGGTYTVNQTVNGCVSPNGSGVAAPKTIPTVYLGDDVTLCTDQTVLLDAGNPGATYSWTPGGETSKTITVSISGHYIGPNPISVTVLAANNCSASDDIIITFDACTGVAENAEDTEFIISPNPSDGIFSIFAKEMNNISIVRIYDLSGHLVYDAKPETNSSARIFIDISAMPDGLYLLELRNNKGIFFKKIVIE
jgi:hypothetical protein